MDKNTSIGLAFLAVVLVAFVLIQYSSDLLSPTGFVAYIDVLKDGAEKAVSETTPESVQYRLVVLTDPSCSACDSSEIVSYAEEVFPGVVVSYINLDSPTGSKFVEKYSLSTVPAYVLNLDVESSSNFNLVSNALTKVGDGYVLNLDEDYVGKRL